MIVFTPKIVFAMSILNKARRTGEIKCRRTREEQAAVIYIDRDHHDWLFWHLQMSRMAALDAGERETLWLLSLERALAALQQKDFGELKRICKEIDTNFNNGQAQKREADAPASSYMYARK